MKTLATLLLLTFGASAAQAASGAAKLAATSTSTTVSGTAAFDEVKDGLKVTVTLQGLKAGEHGFHFHEFGSCEDAGKAAGAHYNPAHAQHGKVLVDGIEKAHAGDLGNITAKEDGTAKLEAVVPGLSLTGGKYSVAGRAVVVHEKVDDFSQPAGNAGARIACGIIAITAN